MNQLYQQMKEKCVNKTIHRKVFTSEEIEALYMIMDDKLFSPSKAADFFHCRNRKISEVIEILKEYQKSKKDLIDLDFKEIADKVNCF
jgi:hypothetical protein